MIKQLLTGIFISFIFTIEAQELPQILATQICECLEQQKVTAIVDGDPCFEQTLVKNLDKLYDHYEVKALNEINFDDMGLEIGAILSKECDYIIPYITNPINKFEEDFVPEKNMDCTALRAGDYYYLTPNIHTNANDTVHVTIKDALYLERFEEGRKYAMLDIKWTGKCTFDLIFKNSNDLFKNTISKTGDAYTYEMVSSTPHSYILKMVYKNADYKFELFKTDK